MDILRRLDLNTIRSKPISEYTPTELGAYLVQKFEHDPITHLQIIRCNGDIGRILYEETLIILRGAGYDKRKEAYEGVSIERSVGRPSNKDRPSRKRVVYTVQR